MIVNFLVTSESGEFRVNTRRNVRIISRRGDSLILHSPDSNTVIHTMELLDIHLEEVHESVTEAH